MCREVWSASYSTIPSTQESHLTATATIALLIFVGAYVLLAIDKIHRTKVALGGAALMLLLHITDAEQGVLPRGTPGSSGTSSSCCSG